MGGHRFSRYTLSNHWLHLCVPRITNVAYEMAWLPLGLVEDNASVHFLFSLIFNLIAMGFMIRAQIQLFQVLVNS